MNWSDFFLNVLLGLFVFMYWLVIILAGYVQNEKYGQ
jgi:hypothetical protein